MNHATIIVTKGLRGETAAIRADAATLIAGGISEDTAYDLATLRAEALFRGQKLGLAFVLDLSAPSYWRFEIDEPGSEDLAEHAARLWDKCDPGAGKRAADVYRQSSID